MASQYLVAYLRVQRSRQLRRAHQVGEEDGDVFSLSHWHPTDPRLPGHGRRIGVAMDGASAPSIDPVKGAARRPDSGIVPFPIVRPAPRRVPVHNLNSCADLGLSRSAGDRRNGRWPSHSSRFALVRTPSKFSCPNSCSADLAMEVAVIRREVAAFRRRAAASRLPVRKTERNSPVSADWSPGVNSIGADPSLIQRGSFPR